MKVAYITIQFPNIAETFASTDIGSLRNIGVYVSVFSMRCKHKDNDRMIKERLAQDSKRIVSRIMKALPLVSIQAGQTTKKRK